MRVSVYMGSDLKAGGSHRDAVFSQESGREAYSKGRKTHRQDPWGRSYSTTDGCSLIQLGTELGNRKEGLGLYGVDHPLRFLSAHANRDSVRVLQSCPEASSGSDLTRDSLVGFR